MKAFFLKAAVAVMAIVGSVSTKVEAQTFNPRPATFELDPNQYTDIQNHPNQAFSLLRQSNNTTFRVVDDIYREVNVENPSGPGPIGNTPCTEQMTPALYNYYADMANRNCQIYFVCVQGGNCAWWLYIFRPTSAGCQINWPSYAYSMPADMY